MIRNMSRGIPRLFKQGTKHLSGLEEAILKNLEACQKLTEITRTSLGPNGMNKMLINHLDKMFVTSDCATILREMEIQHPAAKMIVMAAAMQEHEIGDGSNFVVCIAGELLAKAVELIHTGLHPSEILSGYKKAGQLALKFLDDIETEKIESKDLFNSQCLARVIRSAIASKQYGYEDFLAPLIAKACLTAMPKNTFNFNVDNVRVVKLLGGGLDQSEVVKGMVIPHDTSGTIKEVKQAKIAVFTCALAPVETENTGKIVLNSAEQLLNFNSSEERDMESMIKEFADSGIKVLVTGSTIDPIALHFIEKFGIMVVRSTSKFELRRLCRATKSRPLVELAPVHPDHMGYASRIYVREVGDQKICIFEQDDDAATQLSTVILRASTMNILNDIERAVDDGVNVIKACGRDSRFVAGGGASEIELAHRLQEEGAKSAGLDQYAIAKFAEALEVVPRTLAENAGLTAVDVIAELYAAHEKGDKNAGVDIKNGGVRDMTNEEDVILDLLITKKKALRLAVDAVITVLRVDQIISAKLAGGPKMGQKKGHWDDDD